jgi:hypothetical protein
MKAHGILPGATGSGVKKEEKDTNEANKGKARVNKKRKLEEVNPDEDDTDEPVKSEPNIKGEVKCEDAIVKPECRSDDVPIATPPSPHPPPVQPQPISSSANTQSDDDDEVLFVSAIERRPILDSPSREGDHRVSHAPSPMAVHGTQSIDYAANMNLPQQLATPYPVFPRRPTARIRASSSFPYGLTPTAWNFQHDHQGCP